MDFVILNQDVQVCKGVGSVQFMIENKAGEVDDFQVKLYSATGVVSNDSVVPAGNALGRGATALFTANYSGMAPADIIEMHVVPKLKSPQGSSMFCTDVKLVAKNIDNC
ncbi:TPA: hypothetical protein HA265_01015 [Candidatus Woesearchaeota archaeon]|nr:hypothetical protein [Candidatus Woesearchaeota archaeon]